MAIEFVLMSKAYLSMFDAMAVREEEADLHRRQFEADIREREAMRSPNNGVGFLG